MKSNKPKNRGRIKVCSCTEIHTDMPLDLSWMYILPCEASLVIDAMTYMNKRCLLHAYPRFQKPSHEPDQYFIISILSSEAARTKHLK